MRSAAETLRAENNRLANATQEQQLGLLKADESSSDLEPENIDTGIQMSQAFAYSPDIDAAPAAQDAHTSVGQPVEDQASEAFEEQVNEAYEEQAFNSNLAGMKSSFEALQARYKKELSTLKAENSELLKRSSDCEDVVHKAIASVDEQLSDERTTRQVVEQRLQTIEAERFEEKRCRDGQVDGLKAELQQSRVEALSAREELAALQSAFNQEKQWAAEEKQQAAEEKQRVSEEVEELRQQLEVVSSRASEHLTELQTRTEEKERAELEVTELKGALAQAQTRAEEKTEAESRLHSEATQLKEALVQMQASVSTKDTSLQLAAEMCPSLRHLCKCRRVSQRRTHLCSKLKIASVLSRGRLLLCRKSWLRGSRHMMKRSSGLLKRSSEFWGKSRDCDNSWRQTAAGHLSI